ncbi:LOW QUALITY PROTEIN: endothelial cell-selective adhesion molecule [Haemorhous mexicanus]|uniref:LOW QUALITY PROTEIN: endothelial cell-selective adhesion molecule n=1 Tax=Haemorhous mexicanus TaxID=30427 RepID=UPI0028BEBE2E|nr:LOW QUALITY PROTEIN: endothelial cell-selective adhesion molecule [Haemorhous mexicanus]
MGALRRAALALAALLGVSLAVLEVHVGTSLVFSVEGQQAVLPVWYTSNSQNEPYITWMLNKKPAPFQILSFIGGVVKVEETDLMSRVGFLYPILSHNISLFINATREQDSGQYMCTVNVVDDTIRMHKNVGIINLTVLVPPATPTCQLHGNAVVGANVTLSCSSKKGKPSPMYQWQREPPTLQVFFPPAQDRARGTLKLTNLSLEMSGVYVCRAENQAGSKNCSIVLEVQSTSTKAVIAGAVLGSLGALATIIFFAQKFVGYRRKKRDSQEEGANEIKEDAMAPKTPSWARRPASDTMSKTSTLSSIAGTRQAYGARAPSDTASILTTTGSYRGPPPRAGGRPPASHPPAVNGTPRRRQDPAAAPAGSLPPSSLARAGAVPVMVPAQSRAGSLV